MPEDLIRALISFFAIIDPIGNLPVFHLLLIAETGLRQRAAIAMVSTGFAFAVLYLFAIAGESVLDYLGISLASFQIAAGVLLFLPALRLVETGQPLPITSAEEPDRSRSWQVAIVPLALPLLAGPGALATAISYTNLLGLGTTVASMGLILALTALLFTFSAAIFNLLGEAVLRVIARLVGIVLMAVAIDLIVDGLTNFFG